MRHDLFISYRRSQQAAVLPVIKTLEDAGISCFLDTDEIDPLAAFPEVLRRAIADAKAVLIWWSQDYGDSEYCLEELTLAWQYARAHGSEIRQRLWLVNPEPTAAHIFAGELATQNFLTAESFNNQKLLDELAARLQALNPLATESAADGLLTVPQYGGRYEYVTDKFTGRQHELWQLRSLLHPAKIQQTAAVMIQTHGLAGLGKTELARAYVKRFGSAYPGGVFWLSLAELDQLQTTDVQTGTTQNSVDLSNMQRVWLSAVQKALDQAGYADFYHQPDGQQLTAEALYQRLQQQGPWHHQINGSKPAVLWLLDNVPALNSGQYQTLQQWLQAPMAQAHTLITTRYSGMLRGYQALEIKPLPPETALKLLNSYRPVASERTAAASLVSLTGAHTKALVLLAEYTRHSSYSEVLAALQAQKQLSAIEQIATELQPLLGEHATGIVATYAISVARLSDTAKQVLALACQCEGNSAIPQQLLQQAAASQFNLSTIAFTVAVKQLVEASLMRASQLQLSADQPVLNTLELHPLTIQAGWLLLQHEALPAATALQQQLIKLVLQQFDEVEDNRTHDNCRPYLSLAHFLPQQHLTEAANSLRHRLGMFYEYAGWYLQAKMVATENQQFFNERLGAEHPNTLASQNNLASTLRAQGDLKGARLLQETVLEAQQRVLGAEHPDTLGSKNNLASTLKAQGDLVGARALEEAVLEVRQRVLSAEHSYTLVTKTIWRPHYKHKAIGRELGRCKKPCCRCRSACWARSIRRRLQPNTIWASTLKAQGDLAAAKLLLEEVLRVSTLMLGAEHPNTLTSKNNLAATLMLHGNVAEAFALQQEVLVERHRVLGVDHPSTLSSKHNMASIFWQLAEYQTAVVLMQQAVTGRIKTLGGAHPETQRSMHALAQMRQAIAEKE